MGAGRRPRTAPDRGQVVDAERAQAPDRAHDGRLRLELFEDRDCAARERWSIAFGQGARLIVGAAELSPNRGSAVIVASEEYGVRLRGVLEVGCDVPLPGLPEQP